MKRDNLKLFFLPLPSKQEEEQEIMESSTIYEFVFNILQPTYFTLCPLLVYYMAYVQMPYIFISRRYIFMTFGIYLVPRLS